MSMVFPRLVLASQSPTRLSLCHQMGIKDVITHSSQVDETVSSREKPRDAALRLAKQKMAASRLVFPDNFLLTADTMAVCQNRILDKTDDPQEALAYLKLLSGRRHRVFTGVCVMSPEGKSAYTRVETTLQWKRMTSQEMDQYIATQEWRGCAGGYTLRGMAERFVMKIHGSYSNVLGLPQYETMNLLQGVGFYVGS